MTGANEPWDVSAVRQKFQGLDIYLFDQVVRGRVASDARIFDAGCGRGRNVRWFLEVGHRVRGVDADPAAIEKTRALARELQPSAPAERFRVANLAESDLSEERADLVICNAVLHFARDHAHFRALVDAAWSALVPGGLFFSRLASSIGLAGQEALPEGEGRFRLPDGTDRYLVDADRLATVEGELGAERLDKLKTTVVDGQRCMTTWVLRKPQP